QRLGQQRVRIEGNRRDQRIELVRRVTVLLRGCGRRRRGLLSGRQSEGIAPADRDSTQRHQQSPPPTTHENSFGIHPRSPTIIEAHLSCFETTRPVPVRHVDSAAATEYSSRIVVRSQAMGIRFQARRSSSERRTTEGLWTADAFRDSAINSRAQVVLSRSGMAKTEKPNILFIMADDIGWFN